MSTYVEMLIQAVKDGRVQLNEIIEPYLYAEVRRRVNEKKQKNDSKEQDGLTVFQISVLLHRSPLTIVRQIKSLDKTYEIKSARVGKVYRKLYSRDILNALKQIKNERRQNLVK